MGSTFKIIEETVEENGQNNWEDVIRVKQLLLFTGCKTCFVPALNARKWTSQDTAGLLEFQEKHSMLAALETIEPGDPTDLLFEMAKTAGLLLPIPEGKRGQSAFWQFYETCLKLNLPYGFLQHGGGTRMIWPLNNKAGWAIATRTEWPGRFFGDPVRLSLNCVSFANLVLALWEGGILATGKYQSGPDHQSDLKPLWLYGSEG
jgi:hypothetical protein